MKFIKLLRFDLNEGIMKNKFLLLCPVMIAVTMFISFYSRVNRYVSLHLIQEGKVTFADYYMYLYGGMKEYIPEPGNPFLFPIMWLLIFVAIPFIVVNYPFRDMQSIGQQVLVHSTGRTLWWISKCCWNVIATLLYHGILLGVLLLLCIFKNIPISRDINLDLQSVVFMVTQEEYFLKCKTITIVIIMLPILVSIAMDLFQMMISLFLKPMFSFLVIAVIMVSSSYLLAGYMIGNYAMIMRLSWINEKGVSILTGYIIVALVSVVSVVIGKIKFRNYDIINRE